ncbi:MAG: hypothetical protein CMJ20_07700 [Phycisphaeraceae bacterium]|nr:hypothetical protein [Phycisphaeraceae bacterium]|tara:strand:+ start:428 stop:1009 length:582 start_codon:yes stop_codon:yes gene_type:complete
MKRKTIVVVTVLVALLLMKSGCGTTSDASAVIDLKTLQGLGFVPSDQAHHDSKGRVLVELAAAWHHEYLIIRAIFTPDSSGFHLYSAELPSRGINGVGRPTLVEVSNPKDFQYIGALSSDKVAVNKPFPILATEFPIYPDGPVVLYLPVIPNTQTAGQTIELSLTYMACSDRICHDPIEDTPVNLQVPVQITN